MFSENEAALGVPQLGVIFLADCNCWGVDGTPNSKLRQMLKSTESAGFWQCSCTVQRTFIELVKTKFQISDFLFASLWQLGRGKYNAPTPKENL